jgi:hypothetical protein
MSLDNIQLPSMVVKELYKDLLVGLNLEQLNQKTATTNGFQLLGKFSRKVLIIVDNNMAIYLPDEELQFLLGILSACKLTMDDVSIANKQRNAHLNYTAISTQLEPSVILLFGIEPLSLELPLSFPFYQVQKYNNQVFLSAPALSALQGNKDQKTMLWKSLQQIFLK